MATKIEWADRTWNLVTGCTPVSTGCQNCWAKSMAERMKGKYGYPEDEPFAVTVHRDRAKEPFKWKKGQRVFVSSMGDLFHEDVPPEVQGWVYGVAKQLPQHTFLLLTKRPENMLRLESCVKLHGALDNLWFGTSIENQATADERIRWLLQLHAIAEGIHTWVNYEPALGPICLSPYFPTLQVLEGGQTRRRPGIEWVAAGCESGKARRQADPAWFKAVKNDCVKAGIPFFLKQMDVEGKIYHTPPLDGGRWVQLPEEKKEEK